MPEKNERREASVLFCDLLGYTAWNEEAEPEEVAAVMGEIRRKAIHTFETYGGVANQFIGDEVVGLFGVASSHEDDPCRAVAAALALHAFVREHPAIGENGTQRPLRLHTGIETGTVYACARDSRSGVYEITGDPVNTAARLRSLSDSDEIIVGPETERRIAPFYETEALSPTSLRGKSRPVTAYRVVGRSASTTFFDAACARGLTRYVGRDRELSALRDAWGDALAGRGSLITASGPPGIGKTRLFYEFRRHAVTTPGSPLVLHGRCSAYGNVAPYQPFIDAISAAIPEKDDGEPSLLPSSLRALGGVSEQSLRVLHFLLEPDAARVSLPKGVSGEVLRDATLTALAELTVNLAMERPVLVVLEDFQWADEASRTALRYIAERLEGRRVLVAVNYRDADLAPSARPRAARHLELSSFDAAATEAMASDVLVLSELPAAVSQFIHERTQGNPFFVEEICRSLLESGAIERRARTIFLSTPLQRLRAPATVQAMVRARVDRLSPLHREVLCTASVIGAEFGLDLLETLLSQVPDVFGADRALSRAVLGPLLDDLEVQGLAYRLGGGGQAYRFKHAITREVVYESVPLPDRRQLHAKLAELLEARYPEESREPHYETLAHHYGLGQRRREGVKYAVLAADKAWRSFSLEQADRQYRRAVELLDALQPLDDESKRLYIDVSLSFARIGIYNPREDQVAALRTSLLWAEQLRDARSACVCLNWMSWIEYALGNQALALEHGARFLAAARSLGDNGLIAQALTNVGLGHAMSANYGRAVECIEQGIRIRARYAGTAYAYALGYLALIAGDQGDFERAHALIEEATPVARKGGRLTLEGPLLVQKAMVECWQGSFSECLESARAALGIAERIEGNYIRAMSRMLEAFALFMMTRDRACLDHMRSAVELLERNRIRLHLSFCWGLLAEALILAGEGEEALLAASEGLGRTAEQDNLGAIAVRRVQGMVAGSRHDDLPRAEEAFQHAIELAAARSSPREEMLTRLRWAEVLRALGLDEGARVQLRLASEKASEMPQLRYYGELISNLRERLEGEN